MVGEAQRSATRFGIFSADKMNTRLARTAVPEAEAAWLENIQPVGPNNLVVVPAPLAALTTIAGEQVTAGFGANIGAVDYSIVFTAAGAGVAINMATGAQTTFAPDGTFSAPDMTVYASQRILIMDPTAGYCTWDGSVFVRGTGGSVSPNISVTAGGSGYTTAPAVTIGGSGSGATAHAVVAGGAVVSVVLDTAGTGYGGAVTVSFGGPGTGATASARVWPVTTGTTIAVFSGRVWWANARTLNWTGTAGYDDTNVANAAAFAERLCPILAELDGRSANAQAAELNRRGVQSARGGRWTARSVINLRMRLGQ